MKKGRIIVTAAMQFVFVGAISTSLMIVVDVAHDKHPDWFSVFWMAMLVACGSIATFGGIIATAVDRWEEKP